ncbi:hypothetical protein Cgig2_028062 [Carnegiea gigantea]|uniref:Uncharacterized protein n=1 Tax=Carnegiea gigantea TaxID=171969 RepID=A0A9Q1JJ97_9CARY|nr:hypothetical protein Cgig2_028062 [Carnegiea gigantea]
MWEVIEMMQSQLDRGEDIRINFVTFVVSTYLRGTKEENGVTLIVWFSNKFDAHQFPMLREFKIEFGRGYLEEEEHNEELNEEELRDKSVEVEAKGEYQIAELHPSTHASLKRIRKVVGKSMSDALIRDAAKKSKSRILVLLQDLYESEWFLMELDMIEKHFMGSRDVALPNGVVCFDSEPDIPTEKLQVLNCDVEDVLIRGITSSTHYISTPLPPGTFSYSLIAKFLILFDESKWQYGFALFLTIIIKISDLKQKIGDHATNDPFAYKFCP